MKNTMWIRFICLLAIMGCTANGKVDDTASQRETLPVTTLITRDTILAHEYVADVQAVRNVEIRAKVSGYLDKIFVDEGKDVKEGQLLFALNQEEYNTELARAKANLSSAVAEAKAAELEMERVRILVDKKVVSTSELEVAKAKLAAAQARIEEARSAQSTAALRLAYTQIKSPFNGVIDRIPLKMGSLIEEGTLLTTVSDVKEVFAYFNVSENEYLEYVKSRQRHPEKVVSEVSLILADGTGYPHPGVIETLEGEFNESTGSIAFRARFPNPEKILKHGSTGRIRLANEVENAVLLPQKSVFEVQDKNYVFVVDASNTVQTREFKPGSRISHFYIVREGLKPGDRVV
ncbi:MAG: efflux RND transporter periplasmic adaptor subunit, partial [Cytophagales bacterium]|nr:efflux RND transporter periplasmic adaptor subunit [Cytophagales bacterium]